MQTETFDRIVTVDPGISAVVVRNIPGTLPIFATHFPRFPLYPGVLLLDTIAAASALAAGLGECWELREARGLRWRAPVRPGDCVEIQVTAVTDAWRAIVTVDGRKVASADRIEVGPTEISTGGTL
ncbi:beta-hydroxyacyl-ACP dehydratase [Nocardia sp. BSTN01]|uniref:3-hydroxyacyl-ACP dehydratase FabZ family protein n=1 Tax=Nocardia sp. BSTN01 TaxID=2783665 RepID=UPI00188F2FCC|nr:beta-hydroxyacyl-ACP dehydratase [Nocardia sp. BSTN01]MBF5002326.1 beta-hydroxyacyl-ACP dehydratase [Nocardia sp. BSTN01]